jgi:ABC-type multidrug transport system ATPase subunit
LNEQNYLFDLKDVHWEGHARIATSFSVKLPKHCITGIVGPSGCGKSTLLRAIAGRDDRIGGTILRNQSDSSEGTSSLPIDQCVLMTQAAEDVLMPWYSVRKYWSILAGGRFRSNDKAMLHLATLLGLTEGDIGKRPPMLSGGQRRRVAFAAALLRRPKVLLLDEPFAGLDFDVKLLALDLLKASIGFSANLSTGCDAVIVVSHSLEDVATICDRVIILEPTGDSGLICHVAERGFESFAANSGIPACGANISEFESRLRSLFPHRSRQ